MKEISLIAAVDTNWGIGYQNELLFHLKKDMKFFREKTLGNTVVMGRKTLESFPGGKPLSERTNIVLSKRNVEILRERYQEYGKEFLVFESCQDVITALEQLKGEVFVIGGGEIYREFLPYASEIYLTRIEEKKKADTYFPNLDESSEWKVTARSNAYTENEVTFRFLHYVRQGK